MIASANTKLGIKNALNKCTIRVFTIVLYVIKPIPRTQRMQTPFRMFDYNPEGGSIFFLR